MAPAELSDSTFLRCYEYRLPSTSVDARVVRFEPGASVERSLFCLECFTMHLLQRKPGGKLALSTFTGKDVSVPAYAILSHTWAIDNSEEVTFQDIEAGMGSSKAGYRKIQFCLDQAEVDGIRYCWIDTCCIDKKNAVELSEAINSMFRWYQKAARCYVFLSDVTACNEGENSQQSGIVWETAFRRSRWFTRGWTLQELIAPTFVDFFSNEGERLGNKMTLETIVYDITGIAKSALTGNSLSDFSVSERMSWAEQRNTKQEEDEVYSLLGIFDVSMPLIYGEGKERALRRLNEEIIKSYQDMDMEPPMKRRKMELGNPVDNRTSTPQAKKDLLNSLRFDQIDDRFMNIKPNHVKTCKWLLESKEFSDWLDLDKLSEHHGFFWIKGKPGCGKSTLTKFAFMEIKKKTSPNTTLLSFFFNARGSPLERSTSGLYRSLLVQLLEKCYGDQRVWNALSLPHWASDEQLTTNAEILKQSFAQAIQVLNDIKLVVDALDECDEDEVRDMITFFARLGEDAVSDGRAFHVFFSSRHYPYITLQGSIDMKLDDQYGHAQDIERYVSSELKAGRGKQAELIRQEVRERASGIFMWVVLVVGILNKASDHGHVHALQKKLREIPNDLNELFRSIITRDRQNMDEMKLCLQWILHANRPLKREELYFAIISGIEPQVLAPWDPNSVTAETIDLFILSSSKGLAEITRSKHHTVQFIHESVREFLLKENGLSQVWADLSENSVGLSHNRLKECCLNYMEMDIVRHLDVARPLPTASTPEASELRKKASVMFPFLEYAVRNILTHADSSHAGGVDQNRFIKQFEPDNWIQLNNIVERYQVRRLAPDIDILYVLAEKNCASLIDILMRAGLPLMRRQSGRYGNPIFAALANDNRQAFETLVKGDRSARVDGCFPYPCDDICSFLVKYGKNALVHQFLSAFNVDPNSILKSGGSMLSWAAENGYENIVELLISKGANSNGALFTVSARGHKAIAEILIERGANVNAQGGVYGNALCAASDSGHKELVELLVDRGADVNAQTENFGSALNRASNQGHKDVVQLLLDRGANINAQSGVLGSALYTASHRGNKDVVQLLLDRGADINAQTGKLGSALCIASNRGHKDVMQLLLDRGADVNAQTGEGSNALTAAIASGDEDVVKLLLDRCAEVNAPFGKYGKALCIASEGGYKEVVQLLLDRGADINAQDKYGNALCVASAKGHEQVVELLLNRGVNVNARVEGYGNALQAALIPANNPTIQQRSIYYPLPRQGQSKGGNHALQDYQMQLMLLEQQNKRRLLLARQEALGDSDREWNGKMYESNAGIYESNMKILELLLDRGADVNMQGGQYGSPLQAASVFGSVRAIKLLLQRGASVDIQGGKYGNALQAARARGWEDIVKLLQSRHADVNVQDEW